MSQEAPDRISVRPRVYIVDAIKGIAIILVVFGHTEQGAMHRQIWNSMPGVIHRLRFADAFIYSFHMPAFFFVSGLFLCGSVQRRGYLGFILEKARTLLYPYVLWSILAIFADPFTLSFRSAVRLPTMHERISGVLTGNASWFLITLFFTQLLALLILRLPYWLQMLLAFGACLLIPTSNVTVFYKPFQYLPFVVAGMWLSEDRVRALEKLPRSFAWIGFVVTVAIQFTVVAIWGPVSRWTLFPIGLCGFGMLLLLSQAVRATIADRVLGWYGEASLGIFVLSPFFQGAGREFVGRVLHATQPLPYLVITTLFATTFPAAIWFWRERLYIAWLFSSPRVKKRVLRADNQPAAS